MAQALQLSYLTKYRAGDVSPVEVAEIRGMPGMHGTPMAGKRPTHTEVRLPLCPSFYI